MSSHQNETSAEFLNTTPFFPSFFDTRQDGHYRRSSYIATGIERSSRKRSLGSTYRNSNRREAGDVSLFGGPDVQTLRRAKKSIGIPLCFCLRLHSATEFAIRVGHDVEEGVWVTITCIIFHVSKQGRTTQCAPICEADSCNVTATKDVDGHLIGRPCSHASQFWGRGAKADKRCRRRLLILVRKRYSRVLQY